jgi:1,4-dihydroxy-2-naphthoate octaprenyltransferase
MSEVGRWTQWRHALRGLYQGQDFAKLDTISRWLYASRFLILVISAQSGLIAVLLAWGHPGFQPWCALPLIVGYMVVHAISNFSNDYFGYIYGHDTPDSPRARYTIHPLVHGLMTKKALWGAIAWLWLVALAIGGFFFWLRGWPVVWLFLAGVAFLYLYDAGPKSLKASGLGELESFIVWGPLMIGGGYYVMTGEFSWTALWASIPYGLGIATILIGKHLDKIGFDAQNDVRTLPVIVGDRGSRVLNQAVVVTMYVVIVTMAACGLLSLWALAALLAAPAAWRLLRIAARPRPEQPPEGYVGWPLWMNRFNGRHIRVFGWSYILGLALGDLWELVAGGLK